MPPVESQRDRPLNTAAKATLRSSSQDPPKRCRTVPHSPGEAEKQWESRPGSASRRTDIQTSRRSGVRLRWVGASYFRLVVYERGCVPPRPC